MRFTSAPMGSAGASGWSDGRPMSNAEASRARAEKSRAMLGDSVTSPPPLHDWKSQPVGGRPAEPISATGGNPFESRMFASAPRPASSSSSQRMQGQHGPAMSRVEEFTGAAGVPSDQASGARIHQGPRELVNGADYGHAAGAPTSKVGRDEALFHDGQPLRRPHAGEGTVRTQALHGATVRAA